MSSCRARTSPLDFGFAVCELIGMDVEAIRKELNLKPIEFARALGVTKGYAGDLRTGRRKPTLPIMVKLEKLTKRPLVKGFVSDVRDQIESAA